MKKKILIVGGSGLLGSNFILNNYNQYKDIINIDIVNNKNYKKLIITNFWS